MEISHAEMVLDRLGAVVEEMSNIVGAVRPLNGADFRAEMNAPENVAKAVSAYRRRKKEYVLALYLDARHREIAREVVSIGTLTTSLIHPREVFGPALRHSAAGVIVVHNHPSGDPSPSPEDREVTSRLSRAGELLGIPLVDHVIVSVGGYWSFRDHGGF